MKPLTVYTDFRTYLRDWVKERKAQGLPGSNRWFATKMGINSTSWLTSLLKGIKGLSRPTATKLSEVLKHSPAEARYFETLVAFNQARTLEERNNLYRELAAIRKIREVRKVLPDQYDYYSTWYHSAVRSLIGMFSFSAQPESRERLASMVTPLVTAAQVRKSISLLEKLGFVSVNKDGGYELTANAISSGENTRSLGIANFQQETMRLAQEAMDRYSLEERYIGTMTVGVSAEAFARIRELLVETSARIAEIANAADRADRVYQVNFQAFPLSKARQQNRDGGAAT